MTTRPVCASVADAVHPALVEAARLGWTGTLAVTRTPAGVSARLEGVVVVPLAPVRWGVYHSQALAAVKAADATHPVGAWEWVITLRAGVPQAGPTWYGLDVAGNRTRPPDIDALG